MTNTYIHDDYSLTELELKWNYQNNLLKFFISGRYNYDDGYIQGCKAINLDDGSFMPLMSYIHQEEMHTLVEQFKSIKTWRASQHIEGWYLYSLLVWIQRIAPNSKGYEQMPTVEDKHIVKAIKELMARYFKKVGDRFNG